MLRRAPAVLALAVALCAATLPAQAAPARSGGYTYVALGDSYTSAPLVPPADARAPALCARSARNYPHRLAADFHLELTDVSCAGATSRDLSRARSTDIPAQLAALSTATSLVTVGIGGNDHNLFTSVIVGCGTFAPLGFITRAAPCRHAFADKFAREIAADAATIRTDLREIHRAAPNARVLLVGYPSLFPRDPVAQAACVLGGLPFSGPDIDFLDSVERSLNAMLASAASATRTIFVDTYEPSLGHDMCRLPTMRWIEPMFAISPAAPVHPNGAGQAATARAVARHLP